MRRASCAAAKSVRGPPAVSQGDFPARNSAARSMPSANALRAERVRLPDCDAEILLRWAQRPYGF